METPFLYKYQPMWLDDFELEDDLRILLKTLIEMNSLNILFFGDSGCGKTSLINAIIHEYYGNIKDCNSENILFINNLKEQGISYYRTEVKTFCQTSSIVSGKKKILIVDDIDFINEQSQQVFRNYIDKYSHNVHFIGSCLNTQKVIDSLQSRLTIIKKRNLPELKLMKIINKICQSENINISPDVIEFIISISNKSIRIIVNYLEKFKLLNCEITIELANRVCTNISFQEFNQYTHLCKHEKDLRKAIALIYSLSNRGYSVMDILDNYFLYLKATNMLTEDEKYTIIPYICKYITIFNNVHEDEIELAHFTNNLVEIFATPVEVV
jgi:DNA polymerase III delta prime subunit